MSVQILNEQKKPLQFGIIHITRNFVNAAELVQITQNYRKINFKVIRERTYLRVVFLKWYGNLHIVT